MAAAQLEEVGLVEIDHVRRWRFDELLRAGYDIADAADVALRTDIDLHWAVAPGAAGLPERDRCADRAVEAPCTTRPRRSGERRGRIRLDPMSSRRPGGSYWGD